MSETWYDEKEDVLGMHLKNKRYWKSVEVSDNVVVDLSNKGEIIGIEILGAKRSFKKDTPLIVSKASSKKS
ncbi:MAG: DUF2283 domain-containing protein [Nitrososphaerales archaeon]|nr:DUF2283 domain-containing protein [Nitrososphaerales archaeon]